MEGRKGRSGGQKERENMRIFFLATRVVFLLTDVLKREEKFPQFLSSIDSLRLHSDIH